MSALPQLLLKSIRKQQSIRPGDRLAVAVSGGADSVALLHLLLELRAELGVVLSVAHVNHKLRGAESDEDERFVARLAREHDLELHLQQAPVADRGRTSIEAAARDLRYAFFRALASSGRATKIATAHTLDDQAETVLLRIFRGTGIRGLSAIHPRIVFEDHRHTFGEVLRPLLGFRRSALQDFLRERGLGWREDSSNLDPAFTRNRLRHRLLPMIVADFGAASIEHLAELAEIARAEEDHWQLAHPEIKGPLLTEPPLKAKSPSLPLSTLDPLPLAARRRLVRLWLQACAPRVPVSFRLVEDVLELAFPPDNNRSPAAKLVLPDGRVLQRARQQLRLDHATVSTQRSVNYDYPLPVPGAVEIPELRSRIEARVVDARSVPEPDRSQLLDPQRMPKEIVIRNWRPGDRFWPAHTAAARKVKELLTDRHASGLEKKLWPVAFAEGCGVLWMRGFDVPLAFRTPPGATRAIWIREIGSDAT